MSICGANLDFDAITDATSDLKSTLTSQLGGNFTSATALKSAVEGKLTTVTSGLSSLVPAIPELPALSLQGELTSLAAIDLSNPLGVLDYQSKLASITDSFGGALSSSGFNLDSIVSQVAPSTGAISGALSSATDALSGVTDAASGALSSATDALSGVTSGGDICSVVPNFEIPSGATEALQKATNPKLSSVAGIKEEFTEFTANVDLNAQFDEATAKANKILADPDVQAQISSDVAAGSAQIEKDISSALDKIPADLSTVIPEGGISIPNISSKFPKKFPL